MAAKKTTRKKTTKKDTHDHIIVDGARVNNLKDISVSVPRDAFVVVTGLSGSGKSSLAFDTIYAEGNRRYMESLSSHARAMLDVHAKPDVDAVKNLGPSISIDQKSVGRSPRSTVGTMTEIYDYLRVLYAKIGTVYCPSCDLPMRRMSSAQIQEAVVTLPDKSEVAILAPLDVTEGTPSEHLHSVQQLGYARVRFNGKIMTISEALMVVNDDVPVPIDVVVDRFTLSHKNPDTERITDSIESTLKVGKGSAIISHDGDDMRYNNDYKCSNCDYTLPPITPRHFSFNNPEGACSDCDGLGVKAEIDPELLIPNNKLSLCEGAIRLWGAPGARGSDQNMAALETVATRYKFALDTPVEQLSKAHIAIVLYGAPMDVTPVSGGVDDVKKAQKFDGVIPTLEKKYDTVRSDHMRNEMEKYMTMRVCPRCDGQRLKEEYRMVLIDGRSICDVASLPIMDAIGFLASVPTSDTIDDQSKEIAAPLIREMTDRLGALGEVGVGYLTLARSTQTLSGGEAQRIRLAVQIKSELMGIVYVLDEPSVGLHPRDTAKLIATLQTLRDSGNSLIIVEHDSDIMQAAEWIVDIGPGAGTEGGEVIFSGTYTQLKKAKTSTAHYLCGKKHVSDKKKERPSTKKAIEVIDATQNNLKGVSVKFPLGQFLAVAGVSGSGKSTLVHDILSRSLAQHFHGAQTPSGDHKKITGKRYINKVITITQRPIGRTPRSNAATYTGVFNHIRELFAASAEAKERRFSASRFSFNMRGGRCEACQGDGMTKIEMHLLPDLYVPCETCDGTRYNAKTLEVEYRGVTIADVLDMSVSYALTFFKDQEMIRCKLQTMEDVGLGYLRLGQSATDLSGGEAQRIKLATELARKGTGKTLYILDEPTAGLHFDDTKRLLGVLDALVDKGNTVLVVEHNIDVITHADWVIEMGPDGGDGGGEVIYEGTPRKMKKHKKSVTGAYL